MMVRIRESLRTRLHGLLLAGLASMAAAGLAQADDDPWIVAEMHISAGLEAAKDPEYAAAYTLGLHTEAMERLAGLQSALELAHELGTLASVVELADGYALGVYDANGIWDPFGEAEADGEPSLPAGARQQSLLFATGRLTPEDPYDVGLPESSARSRFQPDIGGAISGVAGRTETDYDEGYGDDGNFYRSWTTERDEQTESLTVVTRRDGTSVHATELQDEDGIRSQTLTVYDEEGVVSKVVRYERGEGRTTTVYREDGVVVTTQDPNGGELEPQDAETGDGSGTDELRDPDSAAGGTCVFAWQCDAPWENGGSGGRVSGPARVLTPDPGLTQDVPLEDVPPIVTLHDVLVNPGYIDGLYISDEGSISGPAPIPDDGVTQY